MEPRTCRRVFLARWENRQKTGKAVRGTQRGQEKKTARLCQGEGSYREVEAEIKWK